MRTKEEVLEALAEVLDCQANLLIELPDEELAEAVKIMQTLPMNSLAYFTLLSEASILNWFLDGTTSVTGSEVNEEGEELVADPSNDPPSLSSINEILHPNSTTHLFPILNYPFLQK